MPFIGNKPSAVPLTSADITDGIIVNADIANSTINLTTKVTGTLPLTNGGTGLATLGTAAQELRVNSGATALEYYTPTVASSDFVRLATTTLTSATSAVSFDGYFTSAYDTYKLFVNGGETTADTALRVRIRIANADKTDSAYYWGGLNYAVSSNGNEGAGSDGAVAAYIILGTQDATGQQEGDANKLFNSEITIFNPLKTGHKSIFYTLTSQNTLEGGATYNFRHWATGGGHYEGETTAWSGITIYPSTGNFDSGTYVLYGLKK